MAEHLTCNEAPSAEWCHAVPTTNGPFVLRTSAKCHFCPALSSIGPGRRFEKILVSVRSGIRSCSPTGVDMLARPLDGLIHLRL